MQWWWASFHSPRRTRTSTGGSSSCSRSKRGWWTNTTRKWLTSLSVSLVLCFSLHTPILPTPIFSLYIPVALWCSGLSDLSLIAISCSSQCSTTSVTKAMLCIILCGMWHIKDFLLLIGKSSPWNGSSGFPLSIHELFFTIIWSTPCNHK